MDGLLPVYKPSALSSFDVVRIFKHSNPDLMKITKIGHAGTLDVFAEGVLLIMLGKVTKQFDFFQTLPKIYLAQIRLGASSSTLDIEGEISAQNLEEKPTRESIEQAMEQFIGKQQQRIPKYSAAKFQGKPLYEYARKGIEIEEKSKEIEVYSAKLISYTFPLAVMQVQCSSGTYIRQLTYDIFKSMNIESFLFGLERLSIGDYSLKKTCSIAQIRNGEWKDFLLSI